MKIELFLEGKRVEINQDIDFVLNKQFTELTDLTTIIVDYSKTIKVPMTPHNNELFNHVYRLDRQFIGVQEVIQYDPSQKIDMYMTFNSSKVMDGYAVLNSVNMKDRTYEINLYGQLGKIFSDLKEKTLGGSPGYHIPNNGWSRKIRMNTYNITKSFAYASHTTSWLAPDWSDFFGFAPQMIGDTDLISTDCYEKHSDNSIVKFTDDINATRSIDYADFYVKDGFDLNGYGEQRTYLCRPYVYVDKIIQMVQNEINQGDYDGYRMILDQDWFNSKNPYWTKMCYFPGTECPVGKGENNTGFVDWDDSERTFNSRQIFLPNTTSVDLDGYTYTTSGNKATISETGGGTAAATLTLNCDGIRTRDRVTGIPTISGFDLSNIYWGFRNIPDGVINIPVKWLGIYDGNNNLIYKLYMCPDTVWTVKIYDSGNSARYKCTGLWNKLKKLNLKNIVPVSYSYANAGENGNYLELTQQYNFGNIILNSNTFTFSMGCDIINAYTGEIVQENVSNSNIAPMMPWQGSSYVIPIIPTSGATWIHKFTPIPMLTVSSNSFRSLTYWTINDILGNDFNPFLWLIDFVKTFRLYFDIDYVAKTITLKRGYFDNITYKRITVDYSKEMIIEPVIDKYHTVDFGYAKNESTKGAKYRKNYGVEYGDINIDTGMNINNDKLSLNPDKELGVFIPSTLNALYYSNLNSTGDIKTGNMIGTNKVINTLDGEGKIQYFPFYAFRTTNYSKDIYITDDTPNQKNTGEFCYLEHDRLLRGWENEEEMDEGGQISHYAERFPYIPQFDNYIMANSDNAYKCGNCGYIHYGSSAPGTCPNCGQQNTFNPANELYWDTFNIPKDVYNGYLPFYDVDSSIYTRRWQNYLSEIFNPHNNKVTCYVKMTYPEFINFKFNQLFVIDNITFLVNKIIDFNPNNPGPTKVELIEISDPGNLQ